MTAQRVASVACLALLFLVVAMVWMVWVEQLKVVSSVQAQEAIQTQEAAAIVNGEPLRREAFIQRLIADHGEAVLKNMISLMLVEQEAKKLGITVTDEEIEKRFELLREKSKDKLLERLTQEFIKQGLMPPSISVATLRAEAKKELLLERILGKELVIEERELREYYARADVFDDYNTPERYRISEIAVSSPHMAQQILEELKRYRGRRLVSKFEELARLHSVTGTAAFGGDRGDALALNEIESDLRQAVSLAKPGEIIGTILTLKSLGRTLYYIIWVRSKEKGKRVAFDQVKGELRQRLIAERMGALKLEHVKKLWEKADIKYLVKFD